MTAEIERIFEIEEFRLRERGDAAYEVRFEFRFREVGDPFISPGAGIVLLRGECTITVLDDGRVICVDSLPTKVTSGTDRERLAHRIVSDLVERAARAAGVLLERRIAAGATERSP